MTEPTVWRYALYGAEWIALFLAWRQFNRMRPGRKLPMSYVLIVGILMGLQLYGEAWRP